MEPTSQNLCKMKFGSSDIQDGQRKSKNNCLTAYEMNNNLISAYMNEWLIKI